MVSFNNASVVFWSLVRPWHFMLISLSYLPGTISRLYASSGLRSLFSWHRLQGAWFSAFWSWAGPGIREGRGPVVAALLEGRITGAKIVDHVVAPPVAGIVLDIGPGLGYWLDLYAKVDVPIELGNLDTHNHNPNKIQKIYGIEPNADLYPVLRKRVTDVGLEGVYEVLPVGIEGISSVSPDGTSVITKGSVDSIVSVLCLCSIPEPEKNIAELYQYLKKGGTWYVYEHVRVKGSWPMRLYQGKSGLHTHLISTHI